MKLIELCLTMAYDAKVNYNDVFFQVRTWDAIIYNYLKKRNIVIPPKDKSSKDEKYAGAYVKEPIPGIYDWVVSFDLNSLYPHLIMQYNISPETLLEEKHPQATVDRILKEEINFELYKDYAVCANGAMYRKDVKGFLPELMEKMYGDRVIFKKKMIEAKKEYQKTPTKELEKEIARCNNIQMAKKISLNSAYGAIRRAESPLCVKATKYFASTMAPTSVAAFVIAPPLVRGAVFIGRIRSRPPSSVF